MLKIKLNIHLIKFLEEYLKYMFKYVQWQILLCLIFWYLLLNDFISDEIFSCHINFIKVPSKIILIYLIVWFDMFKQQWLQTTDNLNKLLF